MHSDMSVHQTYATSPSTYPKQPLKLPHSALHDTHRAHTHTYTRLLQKAKKANPLEIPTKPSIPRQPYYYPPTQKLRESKLPSNRPDNTTEDNPSEKLALV